MQINKSNTSGKGEDRLCHGMWRLAEDSGDSKKILGSFSSICKKLGVKHEKVIFPMDKALIRLLEVISSCGTPISRCGNNIRENSKDNPSIGKQPHSVSSKELI